MLKRPFLVVIGLVVGLTVPAIAQQSATLVLRSGQRISGDLVDHGAVGFTITVDGQTRQIPTNDVATIEFSGSRKLSSEQQAKLNAGQQFVVLNNGQTIEGSLYDIGGTRPLRITIDTSSGQRDFNSTDLSGIYLANAGRQGATSGVFQAGPLGKFVVPGNRQWTPTNIQVNAGDTLRFQVSGQIRYSLSPNTRAQAGGLAGKFVPGAPVPTAFAGALIGRIDNSPAFLIGSEGSVTMPAGGTLVLGINDDRVNDNSGQFTVMISR